MVKYHYKNIGNFKISNKNVITNIILNCITEHEFYEGEVNIICVSENELLEINRLYLNHDFHTDIITFDNSVNNSFSGDLYVSIDFIKKFSLENNIIFESELFRVFIHGILHILGYDDHSDEDLKIMREKEDYYLAKFLNEAGLKIKGPHII